MGLGNIAASAFTDAEEGELFLHRFPFLGDIAYYRLSDQFSGTPLFIAGELPDLVEQFFIGKNGRSSHWTPPVICMIYDICLIVKPSLSGFEEGKETQFPHGARGCQPGENGGETDEIQKKGRVAATSLR